MCEMWKRKQMHEDARKMYPTKMSVKKFEKIGEGAVWEVMTWSEEWTCRDFSRYP